PLPADLMHRVFREYEKRKDAAGTLDFEDLLERTIRVLDADDGALALVRERWRAFTVDEYQDVNLLQQTLLDLLLGAGDELCAVGDDYQSIYGFTGASPRWLLALPERFAGARVVRLEQNYRSTPQILALANRLVAHLGGADKTLRATRADGPDVDLPAAIRAFEAEGIRLEAQAVLVRTNARAADFEELFHDAGIAFQGASLLARDAARGARGDGRPRGGRRARLDHVAAREARRAGADAAGRPRATRPARRAVRGRRHRLCAVARGAVRREGRARRAPADAPPREGPRVRRR